MIRKGFSLVAITALASLCTASYGEDGSVYNSLNGTASGQIRMFYIDRDYDGSKTYHRSAVAVGGHLKYETGTFNGLSSAVAFYTTNNFGIGADDLPGDTLDPTLFGEGPSSYTIIGEAYLEYTEKKSILRVGRQKINTPMLRAHDVRMLPNMYEGYLYSSKDLPKTTFTMAHITKFAAGTFSNTYSGGISGATGGYSYINADMGKFTNIGEYAIGVKTDGITFAGVKYAGIKNLKLQVWDYYVHDILNAIYFQGDYSFSVGAVKFKASAQYVKENDVGSGLATAKKILTSKNSNYKDIFDKVDSNYAAVKFGAKYGSVSGYLAYSMTGSDSSNPEGSSMINMWGSTVGFTNGMVSHHEFYSDTNSWKAVVAYNFKKMGVNANASVYYCNFDLGENNGYKTNTAWTAKESGFDIKYYPSNVKNLQLRLRGNFPRDFVQGLEWNEYRFIVNYNF